MGARARPTQSRTRHSEDALLDAAAEVFRRRGFHAASMLEIAEEAGATKPTLYARVGSKAQLYDRTLERMAQSLLDRIGAAYEDIESLPASEAAQRPAKAFFAWAAAHPAGCELLFASSPDSPTGVAHRERALRALAEHIEAATVRYLHSRGRRPDRATGLVVAYALGLLEQGARWALDNGRLGVDDLGDFSAHFLIGGLTAVNERTLSELDAPPTPGG